MTTGLNTSMWMGSLYLCWCNVNVPVLLKAKVSDWTKTCSQTSRATRNQSQLHSFGFKRATYCRPTPHWQGKNNISLSLSQTLVTHQRQITAVLSANQKSRRAERKPQRWCHQAGSSCPAFRLTLLFCRFLVSHFSSFRLMLMNI